MSVALDCKVALDSVTWKQVRYSWTTMVVLLPGTGVVGGSNSGSGAAASGLVNLASRR